MYRSGNFRSADHPRRTYSFLAAATALLASGILAAACSTQAKGSTDPATTAPPLEIATGYLAEHAADLGVAVAQVESLVMTDQYTDTGGLTHLYLRQQLSGLPIIGADLAVTITGGGQILSINGGLVNDVGSGKIPVAVARERLLDVPGKHDGYSPRGSVDRKGPSFFASSRCPRLSREATVPIEQFNAEAMSAYDRSSK